MTESGVVKTKPQETSRSHSGNSENSIRETATVNAENAENNENNEPEPLPDEWMIRHSDVYKDEYWECKSIQGRFHQYFIFGKMLDCSQWKADVKRAEEWEANRSEEAYNKLIESERQRRRERLLGHINNNIWEKRESPPEEWKNPLPEWMAKNLETSYLAIKAAEHEKPNLRATSANSCTIL